MKKLASLLAMCCLSLATGLSHAGNPAPAASSSPLATSHESQDPLDLGFCLKEGEPGFVADIIDKMQKLSKTIPDAPSSIATYLDVEEEAQSKLLLSRKEDLINMANERAGKIMENPYYLTHQLHRNAEKVIAEANKLQTTNLVMNDRPGPMAMLAYGKGIFRDYDLDQLDQATEIWSALATLDTTATEWREEYFKSHKLMPNETFQALLRIGETKSTLQMFVQCKLWRIKKRLNTK